jgi:AcrR family transcriptional regulator
MMSTIVAGTLRRGDDANPLSSHDRIFQAAKDLFGAKGYDNVSTVAIARRAGTSESQLIKHFGSKEGLLEAIFDEAWTGLVVEGTRAIEGTSNPLDKLQALGALVIAKLERDRGLRSLVLLEGRRVRKRGRDIVLSAGFRRFVELLDGVFHEMEAAGLLRSGAHLEAVRSAWMGALEALMRDRLLAETMDYPAGYDGEDVARTANRILGAFLSPAALTSLRRPTST